MSDQKIMDTPQNWDAASKGYAEKVAPRMMESFATEFVERLDVSPDSEALEVAAGSGALTLTLAQHVKSLLATDFSPKMLEILGVKIKNRGITNVKLALMDGQALELNDHTMDRAACNFGLMLFPDRHKGFSELKRVLKPGGKALVSGWAGPNEFQALGLFIQGLQKAFPDLPKPEAPPPVFSLAELGGFKSQMEAAGFRRVTVDYTSREVTIDGFDQMWDMLTIGAPPVKKLFDQVGESGMNKIQHALAEIIEERFGDAPITLSNTASVGVGIAP